QPLTDAGGTATGPSIARGAYAGNSRTRNQMSETSARAMDFPGRDRAGNRTRMHVPAAREHDAVRGRTRTRARTCVNETFQTSGSASGPPLPGPPALAGVLPTPLTGGTVRQAIARRTESMRTMRVLLAAVLLTAACGGDDENGSNTAVADSATVEDSI